MRKWSAALLLAAALAVTAAGTVRADDHDPKTAAHPVRIAAYVLHPVGVVLDYLIARPAHWLGHKEPIRTLVGHERHPADRLEETAETQP
jgi:hypothetical protein